MDEDRIVELTSKRLEWFNEYLGKNGDHFVEDEEYTQYFSVPYLLTSSEEETDRLEFIFEKEWLDDMFKTLNDEIDEMSK